MAEPTPKPKIEPLVEFVERVPVTYLVAAAIVGALLGAVLLIAYDMHMSNVEAAAMDETAGGTE